MAAVCEDENGTIRFSLTRNKDIDISSELKKQAVLNPPPQYARPSLLEAGWDRDSNLPRRIPDSSNKNSGYRLNFPKELIDENGNPAERYFFCSTPSSALEEFGIGIGIYFRKLKFAAALFLVCALILLASIYGNRRNQYMGKETADRCGDDPVATPWNLLGSTYGVRSNDFKMSLQGAAHISLTIFLALITICYHYWQINEVERIDTDQQTTQDYAVEVINPPEDIYSPEVGAFLFY